MIKCLTNVEIMQKSLHILDDELISELKKTNVLVYRIMISCTLRNALNWVLAGWIWMKRRENLAYGDFFY